jgi:hypothetical protein
MEVLDLNVFLTYKTYHNVQELDSNTQDLLSVLFGNTEKYKNLKKTKKNINILKNQKLQNKKDNIVNRINLILNKLSESNIDNLVIEFIENINQVSLENFEDIQRTFYFKIMSEINFVKIYLKFLKIIGYLYNKVQSYDLSFFISIVEYKFNIDYMQVPINSEDKYNFLIEMEGETKRINNMTLIKNLVDINIISDKLLSICDKIILNQKIYLPDIYHWFNSKNRELNKNEIDVIKSILTSINTPRDKILLENLINKVTTSQPVVKEVEREHIVGDTLKLETENIIEEYVLIKSFDDIKHFIDTRCLDAIAKNKFCEQLVDKYFLVNIESSQDIIDLIKQLIKSHTLFKSNLSRGLIMLNNNWKDKSIDYNKPIMRMKTLLIMMKSIGITKGLESLIEYYLSTEV